MAVRAAERASIDGLDAVSLGQLAADLGISKSGIQAVYRTKEELQLAAVAAATDIFVEKVVAPALAAPAGLARLSALVESWLAYVGGRVFPGGCFMAATVPEFDSRPGPVRDALAEARRSWLGMLEREVRVAYKQGELPADVAPDLLAFEIDALLTMANTACNIDDQPASLDMARALIDIRLGRPAAAKRAGRRVRKRSPR